MHDTCGAERTVRAVETPAPQLDARGMPTHACPLCACNVLVVRAVFSGYDIAAWFTDAQCSNCGTLVTAPCPPDRPEGYLEEPEMLGDDDLS